MVFLEESNENNVVVDDEVFDNVIGFDLIIFFVNEVFGVLEGELMIDGVL